MDFSIFVGNRPRRWVGYDSHHNFVKIGPAFNEKIIKAFQYDMLA